MINVQTEYDFLQYITVLKEKKKKKNLLEYKDNSLLIVLIYKLGINLLGLEINYLINRLLIGFKYIYIYA